ncbi:PP2C family protein-serine/threonine phosphatase [Ruminococcus albus]|uniref:Serine/threonine protein phosphatase PrpC n=1 Tax=Ruminococcus albus TaxID=1264 RepID=A0A1I1HX29_RUMAL|nr:PP2C family serine/threonine-protein phosphatase [Ruminococcus albus]SFC28436.1 Serine/threonine protein phosphatase PrpC [Ruminococcus albus]
MQCEIRSIIGTRKEQQDHAGCVRDEKGMLAVVCDGIGSRADGGASAKTAVDMYTDLFLKTDFGSFAEFIVSATEEINEVIRRDYGKDCGTTVVLAFVSGDSLQWLSVGDSRLYIKRGRKFRKITNDHNYKYILDVRMKKGLIDKETYDNEIERGEHLASFLGMGVIDIMDINVTPLTLEKGDMLLLMTDGIYKILSEETMNDILESNDDINSVADELIRSVEQSGSTDIDNATFAVIKY